MARRGPGGAAPGFWRRRFASPRPSDPCQYFLIRGSQHPYPSCSFYIHMYSGFGRIHVPADALYHAPKFEIPLADEAPESLRLLKAQLRVPSKRSSQ